MGILDLFGKKSDITVVQTPHGRFDLAKESDVKKLRTIAISVQRQTESLTRQEINNWRTSWQQALDVENPTRVRLYDVYRDTAIDGHLSGAIGQINGFVKARSFKIMKSEKEDEELKKIFDSIWFKTLMGFYFRGAILGAFARATRRRDHDSRGRAGVRQCAAYPAQTRHLRIRPCCRRAGRRLA